jgi:hypothetical protein
MQAAVGHVQVWATLLAGIALAIVALAAAVAPPPVLVMIIVGLTVAGACIWRSGGVRFAWYAREPMVKASCGPCGGTGVLWWNGRAWVVIPPSLRTYHRGRVGFKNNTANVKTCLACHGMGFTWRRREPYLKG